MIKTKAQNGREKLEILYEDEWLAVVYKPSGMLSVPYDGSRGKTALSVLEEIYRKRGMLTKHRKPFCVHRLDRDTSGVMMFALTDEAHRKIMDTWHKTVTERLYRAVAENPRDQKRVLPDSGLIDDSLAFNAYNVGYVPKNGRSDAKDKVVVARTHYKVILRGKTHTLFELSLDTGKKNQIRAHLAGKGYPLAGDEHFRARTNPFGRLALHARTLEFDHPFTGEHLCFEVAEPDSWKTLVEGCKERKKGSPKNDFSEIPVVTEK